MTQLSFIAMVIMVYIHDRIRRKSTRVVYCDDCRQDDIVWNDLDELQIKDKMLCKLGSNGFEEFEC